MAQASKKKVGAGAQGKGSGTGAMAAPRDALLQAAWLGGWKRRPARPQWRFLALFGAIVLAGLFVLGFFTDSERVSFHWPVPAYLALPPGAAMLIEGWSVMWRRAAWVTAALGLCAALAWCLVVATPGLREATAKRAPPTATRLVATR